MKGVIVVCLKEMIKKDYGQKKWTDILVAAGVDPNILLLVTADVDDKIVLLVLESTCKVLGISLQQLADKFGDYWVNVYSPKIYSSLTKGFKTSKEYLLSMDKVHRQVTQKMPNAHPPTFDYEELDDKNITMTYHSSRHLFPILLGLIKGVGKYYNDDLKLTVLSDNVVKITFP